MDAIKSYSSQFYNPESNDPDTLISKVFLDLVKSRSADLGRFISVDYAEGFLTNRYIGSRNLFDLLIFTLLLYREFFDFLYPSR